MFGLKQGVNENQIGTRTKSEMRPRTTQTVDVFRRCLPDDISARAIELGTFGHGLGPSVLLLAAAEQPTRSQFNKKAARYGREAFIF